jgi:hypothetical protein
VNVQSLMVGRPGLDPGTLRVFPECPGTFLNVQICWPDSVECPPTSTDVLLRLNSWLDSWLGQGSFQGQATIRFRGSDGEPFELRLGEGIENDRAVVSYGALSRSLNSVNGTSLPPILITVSSSQIYETIGVGYSVGRRPDPRW